jgi:hypothetical protein
LRYRPTTKKRKLINTGPSAAAISASRAFQEQDEEVNWCAYALPFPMGMALTSAFSPALDRLSGGRLRFLVTSAGAEPPSSSVSSFSSDLPLFLPSLFLSFSGRSGHSSTIFRAISSSGSVVSESKKSHLILRNGIEKNYYSSECFEIREKKSEGPFRTERTDG